MIYFSMINLSTNKQLGIILANTNKALAVVLKEATPKEIETILKDKDLKSVINSLLRESAKSQEGDKALLNLVKNNPTLKDLGNITTTAKELLNALKSEKNPLPIETALRKFLVDVKELNEPVLKQKLENSGVFLESRPKNAQNPQVELKNLLVSLERSIEKSEIPSVKLVAQNIKELLKESAKSQERDKTLLNLAKNNPTLKVDNITSTVKELLNTLKSEKNPLPVETVLKKFLIDVKELSEPILKDKIQNSGIFLESRLKNVQNPQVELKNILVSLEKSIEKSEIPSVKLVAQNIKEILAAPAIKEATNSAILEPLRDEKPTLQQSPKEAKSPLADVAKRVEEIVLKLNEQLRSADVAVTKVFEKQLSKVEHLISQKMLTPENFKPAQLQEALQQLSTLSSQSLQLTQNANQEVKGVFDALVKIVEVLKVIQQENTMPKASLEVMAEKKVPEAVKTVVDVLRGVIEKADPLFSKETAALIPKLSQFATPQKLSADESVKEILSGDLKAVLLKAGEEIAKSPHPNQAEILKHVDKMLLQIDYFQLLSHLSNSSSLYLPFSWDSLEEGNINIKKDKNSVFYCDIDLKLKEYGELKLKLALYEENQINIHIYSDSAEFKDIVKDGIASLRSALIEAQITPREIRIFDTPKKSPLSSYETPQRDIDMGFEVKV